MQLSCVKPDQQLLRLQREKLPRLHPCQARKDAATYFRRGCKPKNILVSTRRTLGEIFNA